MSGEKASTNKFNSLYYVIPLAGSISFLALVSLGTYIYYTSRNKQSQTSNKNSSTIQQNHSPKLTNRTPPIDIIDVPNRKLVPSHAQKANHLKKFVSDVQTQLSKPTKTKDFDNEFKFNNSFCNILEDDECTRPPPIFESKSPAPCLLDLTRVLTPVVEAPTDVEDLPFYERIFGFAREELYSKNIRGNLPYYEKHIFIGNGENSFLSWPVQFDENCDELPAVFLTAASYLEQNSPFSIKYHITACDIPKGDVLVFSTYPFTDHFTKTLYPLSKDPDVFTLDFIIDFLKYHLNEDWDAFDRSLSTINYEECKESFIFVCCHCNRDPRCTYCGPILIGNFRDEVARRSCNNVKIVTASTIGESEYAGNIIVFSERFSNIPPPRSKRWNSYLSPQPSVDSSSDKSDDDKDKLPEAFIFGDWYGYVTPDDVQLLIDSHFFDNQIAMRLHKLWRGAMGIESEEWVQPECRLCEDCDCINMDIAQRSGKLHRRQSLTPGSGSFHTPPASIFLNKGKKFRRKSLIDVHTPM